MENIEISDHAALLLRIDSLTKVRNSQESKLKESFTDLALSLNPISIVKSSLHDLASDTNLHLDLTKVGLNVGANLIINQVLGKQRTTRGLMSSVLVEVITTALINSNAAKIVTGISQFISTEPKKKPVSQ